MIKPHNIKCTLGEKLDFDFFVQSMGLYRPQKSCLMFVTVHNTGNTYLIKLVGHETHHYMLIENPPVELIQNINLLNGGPLKVPDSHYENWIIVSHPMIVQGGRPCLPLTGLFDKTRYPFTRVNTILESFSFYKVEVELTQQEEVTVQESSRAIKV